MRASLETAGPEIANKILIDLKSLIPFVFRQYLVNSGSDRCCPAPPSTKKNLASGKSLAGLAFEALELGLALLSAKFNSDVVAEVAGVFLQELGDSGSGTKDDDLAPSQDGSASQTEASLNISKCIKRMQQEFDKFEAQGEYEQARQILCILNPFMNILPNDILADHLVMHDADYILLLC
jgi:hypothetical protein